MGFFNNRRRVRLAGNLAKHKGQLERTSPNMESRQYDRLNKKIARERESLKICRENANNPKPAKVVNKDSHANTNITTNISKTEQNQIASNNSFTVKKSSKPKSKTSSNKKPKK